MNTVHDKAKKTPKKLLFPEMRMTSKIGRKFIFLIDFPEIFSLLF